MRSSDALSGRARAFSLSSFFSRSVAGETTKEPIQLQELQAQGKTAAAAVVAVAAMDTPPEANCSSLLVPVATAGVAALKVGAQSPLGWHLLVGQKGS